MAALARRLASIVLTTMMVVGVMSPAASAAPHASDILTLMNAARTSAGLAPVSTHADLTDDALYWSQHMLTEGSLSHNPNLSTVTTSWEKLGENVGVGPTVDSLHNAFMASASHRGNVLGDYTHVGIAVVEETPTKLWVTVVFMKSRQQEAAAPADVPEPYSKQQPQPATHQPIAATPATASPEATPEPSPEPVQKAPQSYARAGGRHFAI